MSTFAQLQSGKMGISLKNSFVKNLATLLAGTTIAQAIPVLISPLLSRVYTPEDFGVLAFFMAILSVGGVLATLRYELAIMVAPNEEEASQFWIASLIIALLIGGVVLLGISGSYPWISEMETFHVLFFILPILVALKGLFNASNLWLTRREEYKRVATAKVTQTTVNSGSSLLFGIMQMGPAGLLLGTFLGQCSSALMLGVRSWKQASLLKKVWERSRVLQLLKKHSDFPKVNSLHVLVDTLQDQVTVILLTTFFASPVLGLYSFAFRVLKTPVSMIGSAMYQVFFQQSNDRSKEQIAPMIKKIYTIQFAIGAPGFALLFFIAPDVFAFVFGEEWREAGTITQALIPWLFLNFMAAPVSSVAITFNKQKKGLYFAIVNIVLRTASICVGAYYHDYLLGFWCMSISSSLVLLYALYWYYMTSKNSNRVAEQD